MKKIAIITPWFGCNNGGAEVAAKGLAINLKRFGYETEILTTCCKSPYENWWQDTLEQGEEIIDDIKVLRFSLNATGKEKYENVIIKIRDNIILSDKEKVDFFTYGINSDSLFGFVKENLDAYEFIAMPYFQALLYTLVTSLKGKINIIPCFHNEEQFHWKNTMIKFLDCAKNIFFLSEEEKSMTIMNYGNVFGKKIIDMPVIGVGVEINNFKENEKIKSSIPNKYFLYVGRKDLGKGIGNLINWYPLHKDIPLVFIGGGDSSLIPKNNLFIDLGYVGENDKYTLVKNSNGLINLSENESFSIVIMEAWLFKRPVIVSENCDVTKGHCIKSKGGLYVGSSDEFSSAFDAIMNARNFKVLGENGQKYVMENYTWSKVINKLIKEI